VATATYTNAAHIAGNGIRRLVVLVMRPQVHGAACEGLR
jgi:hypothetical protein